MIQEVALTIYNDTGIEGVLNFDVGYGYLEAVDIAIDLVKGRPFIKLFLSADIDYYKTYFLIEGKNKETMFLHFKIEPCS
jgi:hypothetical protein